MSAKLSDQEKLDIVFKKFFGKVSTNVELPFFSEPAIDSRPKVFLSQLFSEQVPTTAPSDYSSPSGTNQKYTSSSNPNIVKYYRYQLEQITPGNNQSFKGPTVGDVVNILSQSIPFNYDPAGSYSVTLEYNDGSGFNTIDSGTGEWVIDPDGGIITFFEYDDVQTIVSGSSPPYLTFFRYEGDTFSGGLNTSLFTQGSGFIHPTTTSNSLVIGSNSINNSGNKLEVVGNMNVSETLVSKEIKTSSDFNLKKNIKKLTNSISKIKQIKGVSFQWKQTNEKSYGVIAQDIEKVLENAVDIDNLGNKAVNYNSLIALSIECIKELDDKVTNLEDNYKNLQVNYKNLEDNYKNLGDNYKNLGDKYNIIKNNIS